MLPRAYSTLDIKSVDDEQRVIVGIASTPESDTGGDELSPLGAEYRLPMPFLWFHDQERPIGNVTFVKASDTGLHIRVEIAKAGVLPWIDEGWELIKNRLVRGLSVGWKPLQFVRKASGGLKVSRWFWGETSAVTVPMNQAATITAIKSIDSAARAALGGAPIIINSPGSPGLVRRDAPMLNVSEQLTATKTEIDTKSARFEELIAQELNEGSLGDQDAQERDALSGEIKTLRKRLDNLTVLEGSQAAQAVSVAPRIVKPAPAIEVKELPKGTLFTRYAMAVAAGKGSYSDTLAYAKQFSGTPVVAEMVKYFHTKAVAGSTDTGSGVWGGELVNPNTAMTQFVELLMPQTIIGQVQGFDRVPFNIPIITQTGGSTFAWVNEGAPKPVGELSFDRDTLGKSKCAGIIVMTEELARLSSPSAEARARQDMVNQCRKFLDEQFIQVAVTAGSESPASITNGVSSPAATGTDVDSLKADLITAFGTFTTNHIPLSGLVIVTTPDIALGISLMTNALGQAPAGFNVTPTGGTLLGYPVIVSESVDSGTVVIFKPSEIFLADDGDVRIDASNQATLDMSGSTTATFNLWQRNCVGLRAERWINWKKKRANVVAVIDTAAYGPTAS